MAALEEMPFGRYYGSVDATPLFVLLAGAYYERTGRPRFHRPLWPHVEAALAWIDRYGDRDGDGFVEYQPAVGRRAGPSGLEGLRRRRLPRRRHARPTGPIALCEVQGYVYAARRAGAALAAAAGPAAPSGRLTQRAETAADSSIRGVFWCEDLGPTRWPWTATNGRAGSAASNAGQCLFTRHRRPAAGRAGGQRTLMGAGSFSGWGVRTLDASRARATTRCRITTARSGRTTTP